MSNEKVNQEEVKQEILRMKVQGFSLPIIAKQNSPRKIQTQQPHERTNQTRTNPTTKTHYLMTPSGRYYLQTEDKKYTLILQNNFVKLTNHTYSFEFTIGSYVSDELIALVERAIEKTRSKMEDELSKNEINILKEMLK